MDAEIRERTDAYIHARHHHPAWQLLAARRAPLILSCLQTLFEHSQNGVGFDDALRALAEMLADRGNAGEFESGDEDYAVQAPKELRSWIKLSLVVERERRAPGSSAVTTRRYSPSAVPGWQPGRHRDRQDLAERKQPCQTTIRITDRSQFH